MMYQIRRVASYLVFVSLWMGLAPSLHAQRADLASGTATTGDPVAIVWEVDGQIVCSHTPPESSLDAFVFDDNARWSATSADGFGLDRGDPMQLTWGIVPDGTDISGFIGEPSGPSDLIAFLDGLFGSGPGGSDLTQRPWFGTFEQIFTRWGELTGIRYTYRATDDGAAFSNSASGGVARPDVRIGGHFIDGQSGSNVLAYNFFPNFGEMIIDTSNSNFYGSSFEDFRPLRNTLSHEHGHGLGFDHVCPTGLDRLMEPFVDTSFDGPQEDDVLMANRGYGDTLEFPAENDTPGTAHNLGTLETETAHRSGVSIDGSTDVDFYAFTVSAGATASVTLTPTGTSYLSGPQNSNGTCSSGTTFDALRQSDLRLELYGLSGTNLLASADANGLGGSETLTDMMLTEGAGTYFVRVSGAHDKAQMYELSLSIGGGSCNSAENVFCDDFESRDLFNWSRVVGAANP